MSLSCIWPTGPDKDQRCGRITKVGTEFCSMHSRPALKLEHYKCEECGEVISGTDRELSSRLLEHNEKMHQKSGYRFSLRGLEWPAPFGPAVFEHPVWLRRQDSCIWHIYGVHVGEDASGCRHENARGVFWEVARCVECMRSWLDRDLPHDMRKSVLMQTDGTIVILAKPPVSDG